MLLRTPTMEYRTRREEQVDQRTMTVHNSSSSYSDSKHSFHYPIPDISMQPPTRWVYEWEDPHFYTILVQEWETTSAWTGQSWQDYKADLLRVRGLNVMSIIEYQMASQMGCSHSYVELLLMCISDYCIFMHDYDYGICMHAYYYYIYMHDCKLLFWCGLLH